MAIYLSPANPITVIENQPFTSVHNVFVVGDLTSSQAVRLSSYTVSVKQSSNIVISMTSNILSISGVYKAAFDEDILEYRTSGLTTVTDRVESFDDLPASYYMAYKYQPDLRTVTSINITIVTDQGTLNTTQSVQNDWNYKRNRLWNFIRRGTIDKNTFLSDKLLQEPEFISNNVNGVFVYNFISDATNVNLRTVALANGWDGILPARIFVNSSVGLYSTSVALPALTIDGTWPNGLTIINYGTIFGAGGAGGFGGATGVTEESGNTDGPGLGGDNPTNPAGDSGPVITGGNASNGGPAISVESALTLEIYNYNLITGGGGGAGGDGGNNVGGGSGGNGGLALQKTTFSSAVSVTVCATADENLTAVLTAPTGSTFTSVEFASYGTPTGICGAFALGGCHASNSLSTVQGYLIGNSGSINIPATNAVFGDPCVGTGKRLYVQATATYTSSTSGSSIITLFNQTGAILGGGGGGGSGWGNRSAGATEGGSTGFSGQITVNGGGNFGAQGAAGLAYTGATTSLYTGLITVVL
jgi:hypothetical protein